jgi:antitoxin (DNA-binding transcriptional repressor) of toxin-antitoxin stability system
MAASTTFISIRELRNQTQKVIEALGDSTGVVTSNGKPVGLLLAVDDDFDDLLQSLRQARAVRAVSRLREQARTAGADQLRPAEISEEIRRARKR